MIARATRILAVTAGLALVGAAAGAALALAAGVMELPHAVSPEGTPLSLEGKLRGLPWYAVFGAPVGAVLGPLAAWLLLRRVPLGRAIAGATLGAFVAEVGAWLITGAPLFCFAPFLGFAAAVLHLWFSSPVAGTSGARTPAA